jgi:endonuclease/exonuclease/phosphatase (EEP) superfamily protein YafD
MHLRPARSAPKTARAVYAFGQYVVASRFPLHGCKVGSIAYDEWRANAQDRMAQADMLAQTLANRQQPAIVAGDLNAPEQSLVVRTLLDTGLRDAFSSAGTGYGYSHGHSLRPHLFSTIRIDHILVSREIGVEDCFVGGKEGSEHRPVIADLWMY